MGILDKPDLPFTREFNRIVDNVVRLSATPVETTFPYAVKGMPARGKSPGVKLIVVILGAPADTPESLAARYLAGKGKGCNEWQL